ncbi:MAG: 30S ribosomal protein S21 [Puniceicoccales bacterium]|jgi:small subunit ribosomal protein S21|nr:30S ribosomal protein S21 [Puniceicoccales bacterium]
MSIVIPVRRGETVDKALRRLKKRLDREGTLRDVRDKRYFEKPCLKRRRKEKMAKFANFLRLRNESM